MSGSFTTRLRYGALSGWQITVHYSTTDGELWRASVVLEVPTRADRPPLIGGMVFAPRVRGFDLVHDLFVNGGGHDRARRLADHMIADMRDTVTHWPAELGVHAPVWLRLVEAADHAQAEQYALTGSYGDVPPGPFQVIARLVYDGATGQLEHLNADLTFDEVLAAGWAVTA